MARRSLPRRSTPSSEPDPRRGRRGVQFDLSSLRWFIVAEDRTTNELLLGGSLSSDPTAAWNVVPIVPSNWPCRQPVLAVDSDDVVVTANDVGD